MRVERRRIVAGVEACQNLQKERYAMNDDTSIIRLRQPGSIDDPLTESLPRGVRGGCSSGDRGRGRGFRGRSARSGCPMAGSAWSGTATVRSGTIQTGIGPIAVGGRRSGTAAGGAGSREDPVHLAHPAEMGAPLEEPRCAAAGALPARHLHRRLPGGAGRAARRGRAEPVARRHLAAHGRLGRTTTTRWQRRDLSARRYVYIWADGVYLQARMEPGPSASSW